MASSSYILGAAPPQQDDTARFETKPSVSLTDTRIDSGGGYERWRSYEHDPTQPGDHKTDVYVAHHRLLAVVACYPGDMPVAEILQHLRDKDVHHKSGVEWDNRPGNLAVRDHGRHSEITQAQIRAWAEDEKRAVERIQSGETDQDTCNSCGESADALCTSADFDGEYCIPCAKRASDGAPIEVG